MVSFSIHPLPSSLAVYRINYYVAWSFASENLMFALPLLQLTSLWPSGVMDTDGIKRAIHKAKDRRKAQGGRRRVCISLAYSTYNWAALLFLNKAKFGICIENNYFFSIVHQLFYN